MPAPSSAASTPVEDTDTALQETLDSERAALESAARANPEGTRSWLLSSSPSSSSSSSPKDGDNDENDDDAAELYEALERRVSTPWFLETIERACALAKARGSKKNKTGDSANNSSSNSNSNTDVTKPEWWSPPAGVEAEATAAAAAGGESDDNVEDAPAPATSSSPSYPSSPSSSPPSHLHDESPYVLVSRDDVVDAVSHFIASYVASLPQSRDLGPAELRSALAATLRELGGRRGRARRIWAWGKWIYRAAALSYGAFGAYTNPWLARAVLAALWTSAKVMVVTVVG